MTSLSAFGLVLLSIVGAVMTVEVPSALAAAAIAVVGVKDISRVLLHLGGFPRPISCQSDFPLATPSSFGLHPPCPLSSCSPRFHTSRLHYHSHFRLETCLRGEGPVSAAVQATFFSELWKVDAPTIGIPSVSSRGTECPEPARFCRRPVQIA